MSFATSGMRHGCAGRSVRHSIELGHLLICDHFPLDDTSRSLALYMTEEEQFAALKSAAFSRVHNVLSMNGLLLSAGERPEAP